MQKALLMQMDKDFQITRPIHLNLLTGWYDRNKEQSNLVYAEDLTVAHSQGRYRLNLTDNQLGIQEFFFDLEWPSITQEGIPIKVLTKEIVNQRFLPLKKSAKKLLFAIMRYIPKDFIYIKASGSGLHIQFFLKGLADMEEWNLITNYLIEKSKLPNVKNAKKLIYGIDRDTVISADRKISEYGSWNKLKKNFKKEVEYLNYATYLSVDKFFKAEQYPFCSVFSQVKYPERYRYYELLPRLFRDAKISMKTTDEINSSERNIKEYTQEIPINDIASQIQLTPYWDILRDSEAQWYARQFLVKYLRWGLNLSKREILSLIHKYNAWSDYNPRITAFYVSKHFREGTAETKVKKPVRKETLVKFGLF